MPPKVIERLIRTEGAPQSNAEDQTFDAENFESQLAEIRKHGLSRAQGQPIPGIDALCAPVFDPAGNIVLGILVMGPSATFDGAWDGSVAQPLLQCASEISRRIGQTPG